MEFEVRAESVPMMSDDRTHTVFLDTGWRNYFVDGEHVPFAEFARLWEQEMGFTYHVSNPEAKDKYPFAVENAAENFGR